MILKLCRSYEKIEWKEPTSKHQVCISCVLLTVLECLHIKKNNLFCLVILGNLQHLMKSIIMYVLVNIFVLLQHTKVLVIPRS